MKLLLAAFFCLFQATWLFGQNALHSTPSPRELAPRLHDGGYEANVSVGVAMGESAFGGKRTHDFALTTFDFGRVFAECKNKDGKIIGSWEFLGELLAAHQTHPDGGTFLGIGPMLRYNFLVTPKFVPFIGAGTGVAWTDIGRPDLGSTLEFISHGGLGMHLFLREKLTLTAQYRFSHISNAGIRWPNRGVNNHVFLAGLSYLF